MFGEKSQNYQHMYRPKLIVRKLINDIKILVGQAVLELWIKTIFCIVLINYPTPFFFYLLSLTVKNRWSHNEMFELYNFIQVNYDYYFSKKC